MKKTPEDPCHRPRKGAEERPPARRLDEPEVARLRQTIRTLRGVREGGAERAVLEA